MPLIAEPEQEAAEALALAPEARLAAEPAKPIREDAPAKPAARSKKKRTFYQSLDLWRGAACLMLVFYHCTFYAAGEWRTLDPGTWSLGSLALNLLTRLWIGVPMFFVVSGYCIAASIDSLRKKPHSLTNYFIRRFRRIYPPLWAALALAVLFIAAISLWPEMAARCVQLPQLSDLSLRAWLGNITASESWLSTAAGVEPSYLMKNTWTLCYEEQFYFVTGLLLFLSSKHFFRAAAVLTAVVFCARHALTALGVPVAGFFCDGHWLMFAMGMLVYQHLKYPRARGGWSTWVVLGCGIAYGLAMRVLCKTYEERHLGEYLMIAGASGMALIWLKPWDQQIATHPYVQPLNWCGKISYSIYLTHFPVVVFFSCLLATWGVSADGWVVLIVTPLALALSLGFGYLFYLAVERHFVNQPT